ALDEALRQIRAELETTKLLKQIVSQATRLLGCTAGGLYMNRPHHAEVELSVVEELPEAMVGGRLSHANGLIGHVAQTGRPRIVHNYDTWPEREDIFDAYHFQTV